MDKNVTAKNKNQINLKKLYSEKADIRWMIISWYFSSMTGNDLS